MSDVEPRYEDPPEEEAPPLPRRPVEDSAEMDITPMIDITFLLLIFFIVCSTMSQSTSVQLPPARHSKGVDEKASVVITIDGEGGEAKPEVYLGDGTSGELLPEDHDTQEQRITEYVEDGMGAGKTTILIKAAKAVKSGEVERVSKAAANAAEEGTSFHIGVMETG